MDRARAFGRALRHLGGLRVRAYDRRGYEASADVPIAADLDEQVDDLLAVIGDEPTVVVGHSFGGLLALVAAQRRPERVVAVGSFESPRPWRRLGEAASAGEVAVRVEATNGPEAAGEAFMRVVVGDHVWERLPSGVRERRRAEGAALVADVRSSRLSTPAYCDDAFTVPVVSGRGTTSPAALARAAVDLAECVQGAELFVVPGADHGVHLSDPKGFAGFVRSVAERVVGVSPER
jgi:pimeloyl-ACP methyl ester carboxylesterase